VDRLILAYSSRLKKDLTIAVVVLIAKHKLVKSQMGQGSGWILTIRQFFPPAALPVFGGSRWVSGEGKDVPRLRRGRSHSVVVSQRSWACAPWLYASTRFWGSIAPPAFRLALYGPCL
jgi:hypothetical protein